MTPSAKGSKRKTNRKCEAVLGRTVSARRIAILEAANQDAVQDFLIESRLGQIQSMELYRRTDLMALFAQGDASMPPLY